MPVSSVVPLARLAGAREASAAPGVEVLGIGFNYGERLALTDVSFSVARAEIFGLLGPNGGGKTTLFKLISTLVPLQSGSARVLGHDLGAETVALRRRIGIGFQHPSVDRKLTVAENLECHGRLYGISSRALNERTDVVLVRASEANALRQTILQQMRVRSTRFDGTIRIELPRGHEFVRAVVEMLGDEIESVTFGKPRREDVFDHLTGHRFYIGRGEK